MLDGSAVIQRSCNCSRTLCKNAIFRMPSNGSAFSGSEMRDHPKAWLRDFNTGESEPTALQQATARNSDLEPQSLPAEYLLGSVPYIQEVILLTPAGFPVRSPLS